MREAWIVAGNDPAVFDAAANPAAAQPAANPPTAPMTPATPSVIVGNDLTAAQAISMADALVEAGVERERVREALNADGIAADGWGAEDPRTDDERTFDRLYPAVEPGVYRPDYFGKLPEGTAPETAAEYDASARDWAASMDLSPEIGSHLIGEALRIGQALGRASEADRALYIAEQKATFTRMAGSEEAAAQRIAAAGKLLSRAPRAFTNALKASGALDSAEIASLLALEAERLALRGKDRMM
jgi:hypothetical protein